MKLILFVLWFTSGTVLFLKALNENEKGFHHSHHPCKTNETATSKTRA